MRKCPIKRKTSDLNEAASAREKQRPARLATPAQLARVQGCSQRTAREYCKRGLIEGAFTTRGGHWRIRLPLSQKTRHDLIRLRGDWPFRSQNEDADKEFEIDWAEDVALAQLAGMDVDNFVATPFLPGLKEPSEEECVRVAHTSTESDKRNKEDAEKVRERAGQIRSEIYKRLKGGQPLNVRTLRSSVYELWVNEKRCPTVTEVARLMGISRDTFYRHGHSSEKIKRAYFFASGESKLDLPDPSGFDTVQRANRKAKKPGFCES